MKTRATISLIFWLFFTSILTYSIIGILLMILLSEEWFKIPLKLIDIIANNEKQT